jgi:cephalosporin-C deacetylase
MTNRPKLPLMPMRPRTYSVSSIITALFCLHAAALLCAAQRLTLTPYKASGIYGVGERVGWTAALPQGAARGERYAYTVRKNNQDVIETGTLDLSAGRDRIEVTLDEPAMIYVQISSPGESVAVGAAVAPERLRPSAPRPADFDRFWASKIKLLKRTPENAVLKPSDSGRPGVEYATIRVDNVGGARVHGQLAKPKRPGKFPALVIFQWAGPPYPLQKQWVTDRAAEGWLTLNIEPHDVLPDQPQSYYDALPQELKNYHLIGRDDRDKSYFLRMYLADYRAVDYIARRPDWDGRTLVVMGTSMGGQQSLAVAGLHPKITHVIVNEPAGCDTNGPLRGRASGYPNWPVDDPRIRRTALYFDPVNFASRIRATSLVSMGFVDTVTPPVGIWIAFNQIKGPKEAVPMVDSPHNHQTTPEQQRPYTTRSAEWLDTLARGGKVEPRRRAPTSQRPTSQSGLYQLMGRSAHDVTPAADVPTPRTDRNSQTAHEQLLEKAKKGRIDVYFLGDSITRRWGTSDEQYRAYLANWRKNFFGWNAANFGWGGDTTQNILWRLHNGELDGVNPRVIVLMAGTNNVGNKSPKARTIRGSRTRPAASRPSAISAVVKRPTPRSC